MTHRRVISLPPDLGSFAVVPPARRQPVARMALSVVALLVPWLPSSGQATPEDVVQAFFAAGSGPAGTQPLDSLPGLFVPSGRIITISVTDTGGTRVVMRTPAEYVESARAYLATATQFEFPTRFWVEEYGNLGHVFCAFEARRRPDGEAFYRGIASFQLLRDGDRWRIVTAYWQGERSGVPLPSRYRP